MEPTVSEVKDWMWLVQTDKGDFFITVVGRWTQEEAADKVRQAFDRIKVDIIGMIPRKRCTGPDETQCTIYEPEKPLPPLGFEFFAGKKLWQVCGRGAQFEAELILSKKG